MKRTLISTFCLVLPFCFAFSGSSFAQSNFYKVAIGAGAGFTQSFTDLRKHDFGLAAYGTLDYLFTPFLSLGLEVQKGEINSGDYYTDPHNRQAVNGYRSLSVNGRISLGQFIDYDYNGLSNTFKGLYVGSGIGAIQNRMKYIVRRDNDVPGYLYPGDNFSKDIFFPLNLGINFYFTDREGFYRYVLNVNYQGNITLGEGLDGYDDSRVTFQGGPTDIYTFFSVGLKYNFGNMGLSRKTFKR